MFAKPQREHEWLSNLIGDWTYESEATMAPGEPPHKMAGRETVRSLGGLWILCECEGEMQQGGLAQMIITLGFDPAKGRFVGTFVGSMKANLWVYDGELDPAGKVLTLNAEGPSFAGDGKLAHYQDIIEVKSNDHRILSSQVLGEDGKWTRFMTSHYRRKK